MRPAAGVLPWDPDAPPFDPCDTSNRESLSVRQVAERFIQLFYVEDNPRDAFLAWMHPGYIQHNPNAPTGRDATLAMMEASLSRLPDLSHEVKRVIWGDAGLVAIHFHFKYEPDTRGYSVVDILRIDGGYIREHWDVLQEVPAPETCKNRNGMF